ncbi:helix-turn-helix domain-containing protein [Liquorilactobacillus capillatus]|uniref:XRE family transcriptional regulator n=1 Tax=Liquorilactobacillus capillatus DSM 19910 TaxID=1423731 RepID=A0A0R1M0I4_9LACO|nr:helix-turn-helix transcriptional regulator [Liquorilactobacillus capillatus]KRL01487.1 XRE family transcriptional regulator [Liquorilactobacillus capillatus DSM 19910]
MVETTIITIGHLLQQTRKQQHLTQKEICTGICSQAMLSSIEHDKYSPNVELVVALCKRLGLGLENLSLAQNYAIANSANINRKLAALCNNHQYAELLTFLRSSTTIAAITTAEQTQTYYYYLGIAEFQVSKQRERAQSYLKLALAEHKSNSIPSVLDRLCLATLAFLISEDSTRQTALYQQALAVLEQTAYAPNLNILYYLRAFSAYQNLHYSNCTRQLITGIDFITAHDSHYMLANSYYLLAQAAQKLDNINQKTEAEQRATIFQELFDEKIFTKF